MQKESILVVSMNSGKKRKQNRPDNDFWSKEGETFSVVSTLWWWNCIYHNGIILTLSQCMKYEDREKPAWLLCFRTLWAVHVSEKAWSFLSNKGHNHLKRWENSETAETLLYLLPVIDHIASLGKKAALPWGNWDVLGSNYSWNILFDENLKKKWNELNFHFKGQLCLSKTLPLIRT